MKTRNEKYAVRVLTIAVQSALAVMFAAPFAASAQTASVAELKRPDNYVEIGATNVDKSSAKFGEYNGLKKGEGSLIGNFKVEGGDAYDGTGVTRYEFTGRNLGTTSRELGVSIGEQGNWSLKFGYDELQHNLSDTYQTPFVESAGGNKFTLPSTFGYVNTAGYTAIPTALRVPGAGPAGPGATAATIANGNNWIAGTRNLTAAQQNAFHTEAIGTNRKNTSFAAGLELSHQWNIQFDINRLDQTGAKLQSVATQSYSTVAVPTYASAVAGVGVNSWKNQGSIQAMSPTNYQTDTINLALNWTGEKAHLSAGYFGSFFRDGYNSYSVMSPLVAGTGSALSAGGTAGGLLNQPALVAGCGTGVPCYPTETMSTAPSNSLHQFNLSGGYTFSDKTKLVGGASFGRNTQSDTFLNDPLAPLVPAGSSLNGLVETTNANLKLTDRSFTDLTLSAGFKYNERNNKTTSSLYKFFNIGANPTAAALAAATGSTSVVNTPYSNRKTQYDLAADYKLGKGNSIRADYEREDVARWCNGVAANPNSGTATSPAPAAGTQCVIAPNSGEDKLSLNYRNTMVQDLAFGLGYAYGSKKSSYDPMFYTPYVIAGNEYNGFRPFFEASKDQNVLKGNVNWQASDVLSFGANAKYSQDKYPDALLGDQDGSTQSLNLDATYAYSDNGSVSVFASWQEKNRKATLTNNGTKSPIGAQTAATAFWNNVQKDTDNTVGVNFTQKGLMAGKLTLVGDLSYSRDVTAQSVQDAGLNSIKTSQTLCGLSNIGLCGDYPNVVNELLQLSLAGNYAVSKKGTISVSYMYSKLSSNDYFYNGYQYGYTANAQLPTNEVSPSYEVQAVGISYTYSFK